MLARWAVCLALLLLCGAGVDAQVLYVDGALTADCASTSYSLVSRDCRGGDGPGYATFASAIAAMAPGDTVAIRGGTYRTPLTVTKSGTALAHLRFMAYADETVIIDLAGLGSEPSGRERSMGISVGAERYIDFVRLAVHNAPSYGFSGRGSTDITITDCEFAYSYHGGIVFETGARITITRSRIHHSHRSGGTGHEAVTFKDVHRFSITDSEVYENGKEGIDAKYGARDGVIARNHVYRNKSANIYIDAASSIEVAGNICHDNWPTSPPGGTRPPCIGLGVETTYNPDRYSTHDIAIYNNVMWGGGSGIFFWFQPDGLPWARFENIRIEYNTIVDSDHAGIWILNGTARNFGGGMTIRNNIIMGQGYQAIRDDTRVAQLFSIDHNLFRNGERSSTFGSHAVMTVASPFVNKSGNDYHLVRGAAARNIGWPIPDILTDLEGRPRPADATDVGAYQFAEASDPNQQ